MTIGDISKVMRITEIVDLMNHIGMTPTIDQILLGYDIFGLDGTTPTSSDVRREVHKIGIVKSRKILAHKKERIKYIFSPITFKHGHMFGVKCIHIAINISTIP